MPALRLRSRAIFTFATLSVWTRVASARSASEPELQQVERANAPATESDSRAATLPHQNRAPKRFVVARDFGVAFPIGAFTNEAAATYGPIIRVAYHLDDRVEIGGRIGYQRGFDKEIGGVTGSLSSIPLYATARWFPLGDRSGPYGGLDVGVNVFRQKDTGRTSFWDVGADSTWVRPSANIGVGWVWSRTLPIDLRVQIASLDLLRPVSTVMVGAIGGYTIFF